MDNIYFKEIQKIKSKWLWLLIIITTILPLLVLFYDIIIRIYYPELYSNNPDSVKELIIGGLVTVFACGIALFLFVSMRLETIVKNDGLYFRFFPFNWKYKVINNNDLKNYEIRNYEPIKEYGGWGIKMGTKKSGWAYTISGKIGLSLHLNNGKNILVGTQQPEMLQSALNTIFPNKKIIKEHY